MIQPSCIKKLKPGDIIFWHYGQKQNKAHFISFHGSGDLNVIDRDPGPCYNNVYILSSNHPNITKIVKK